jgi:hypothetical protein
VHPTFGAPVTAPLENARELRLPYWQLLARGDTVGVRRLVKLLSRGAPTDAADPDFELQFSLLALAVGDTNSATAILDRVVVGLPELGRRLTSEVLPAAALTRVLFLRAQLARGARAEPVTLWSSARILWLHADAELRAAADSLSAGRGDG